MNILYTISVVFSRGGVPGLEFLTKEKKGSNVINDLYNLIVNKS
jgi:hypothetical protein